MPIFKMLLTEFEGLLKIRFHLSYITNWDFHDTGAEVTGIKGVLIPLSSLENMCNKYT